MSNITEIEPPPIDPNCPDGIVDDRGRCIMIGECGLGEICRRRLEDVDFDFLDDEETDERIVNQNYKLEPTS